VAVAIVVELGVLELLIVAGLTGALAVSAMVRVGLKQRGTARGVAVIRDYERRVKEAGTRVTIVGTYLGTGRRSFHHVDVESAGFELRLTDGTIVPVAAGTRVDVLSPAVVVTGDRVTIPDGTKLLFLPPEACPQAGPHKTPAGVAYVRGDALMLFSADATLFGMPDRRRRTSIPRMAVLVVVVAASIALCTVYGPNTRWNALLFLELLALGLDQTVLRGLASWMLCTREPARPI
jgi:hypothetical protein